jgi:putative two-component system response regulator
VKGADVLAKILIVDDNPTIVDLLERILIHDGYTTMIARNGREALEIVAHDPPDLILLDIMMPLLDGFTVCQRLKEDESTALIPVTMITGLDDREHRRRAIEVGSNDFLTKPFDANLLRARIRSQLRVKRLTDQLERTEQVVFMLALAVEAKDTYTKGHLRRLASYSEQLAMAAQLPLHQRIAIRFGGLLHDIGKISIDDAIMRKRGDLTAEEYEQIKQHPDYGARIIQSMRFANEVGPIIRHHHERWDGLGYPLGLSGEAIPIGARIVAIVDAYDAMTTDRPYRCALNQNDVLQRLRAGRGTQWDPQLLDRFIALVEEGRLKDAPPIDVDGGPVPLYRLAPSGDSSVS